LIYTQKRSSKILKGFSLERCKDNDHVRHDAIIGYQRHLHVSNDKPVPMTYVACPEEKRFPEKRVETRFLSSRNGHLQQHFEHHSIWTLQA
jgi:hypothetical protein